MAYGELSKVYDKLIYEDINYDEMINFILNICREKNISLNDYLDIACGTGNITVGLAKNFKTTYAVDLSDDMLREAFVKFKAEKMSPKLICQDMTELELNHSFDLITCILDSTNYILEDEGLQNYFNNVAKHLNDDGLFIFDINSHYKLTEILGNNTYTYNEEEIFYTWENETEDDITSMFLTFFVKREGLYERFDEEHEERAYKQDEIIASLKNAGLKVINMFDGYTKKNVINTTERIVFIVQKA